MAAQRRVRLAVIGAALLAGGATVVAPAGAAYASPARSHRASAAAPTSERFAVAASLAIQGQHVTIDAAGLLGQRAADVTMRVAGSSLELRRIGNTVYLHVPPGTNVGLPKGKTWGRVSLAAIAKQIGVGLPGLSSPGAGGILGPGGLLKDLAAVSAAPPRKVGLARIHGIVTTAYRADLDLTKALHGVPAPEAAALKGILKGAMPSHVPVTVWVDAAGRLVQLQTAFPLTSTFAGAKLQIGLKLRVQGWDFGVPVHVTAPPASSVANLPVSGLKNGLGGLGGLLA